MLYEQKETEFPEPEQFREIERVVLLRVIDRKWMDHIDDMAQLRQGIGLQAYGQKDPIVEYKMAGFDMFDDMISAIRRILSDCCIMYRLSRRLSESRLQRFRAQTRMSQHRMHQSAVQQPRYIRMTHVHVAVARNISSAVDV